MGKRIAFPGKATAMVFFAESAPMLPPVRHCVSER